MNNCESNTVRELSDIELDQVSGGGACWCCLDSKPSSVIKNDGTALVGDACGGLNWIQWL